jgi:outer membrane lipoprotein-sorting protein
MHSRYCTCLLAVAVVSLCALASSFSPVIAGSAEEGALQKETLLRDAINRVQTLSSKTESIVDVKATLVMRFSPERAVQYQYYYSKSNDCTRIELAPGGRIVVFIDSRERRVHLQDDSQVFSLDTKASDYWLSLARDLAVGYFPAIAMQTVYYAGTDTVDGRLTWVFLVVRGGRVVLSKLWIGVDDGFVYREEKRGLTHEFLNVTFNSGLEEGSLRPTIREGQKMPTISEDDVMAHILGRRKSAIPQNTQ